MNYKNSKTRFNEDFKKGDYVKTRFEHNFTCYFILDDVFEDELGFLSAHAPFGINSSGHICVNDSFGINYNEVFPMTEAEIYRFNKMIEAYKAEHTPSSYCSADERPNMDFSPIINKIRENGCEDGVTTIVYLPSGIRIIYDGKKFDLLYMGIYENGEGNETVEFLGIEVDEDENDTTNQVFFTWHELDLKAQYKILKYVFG